MGELEDTINQKPPVWETYNGQLATLRRQGNTLQAIGDIVGVTRERIRQILAEQYGRVEMELLPEAAVARVIGCGVWKLERLRESGITHPVRLGQWFWLYDRDEIEKAKLTLQLQRSCQHCGKPLPLKKRGKYCCPKCSKDRNSTKELRGIIDEQKKCIKLLEEDLQVLETRIKVLLGVVSEEEAAKTPEG